MRGRLRARDDSLSVLLTLKQEDLNVMAVHPCPKSIFWRRRIRFMPTKKEIPPAAEARAHVSRRLIDPASLSAWSSRRTVPRVRDPGRQAAEEVRRQRVYGSARLWDPRADPARPAWPEGAGGASRRAAASSDLMRNHIRWHDKIAVTVWSTIPFSGSKAVQAAIFLPGP
jgi:hypothetical protein